VPKTSVVVGAVLVVVVASGCGGGNGGGQGTKAKGPETTAQVPGTSKLGHFASADGMVRLVVDRSGDKTKIRVDGSNDIIELTSEEVRHRNNGRLLGYAFIAPDGKRMLFVGVDGDLTFIKDGRDELPLVRDSDATALGAPTIKGSPPPPKPPEKSADEVLAEKLAPLSVTKRFPQFKPEDSGNLAKVAEAWNLATADMLMHCNDSCSAWYAPYPLEGGNGRGGLGFVKDKDIPQGPATEQEKKNALAKYNAWLRPNYEFGEWTQQPVKSSWLTTYQFEFRQLQPRTPVLVWDVEKTDVIVVTPDGSRYWDSPADNNGKARLDPGAPPVAQWAAPLRNNLLFKDHVVAMNKAGLVDKKAADEIESIHAKWSECAQKVFLPAQKELEGNLTANTQYHAASKRNSIALRKFNDKAYAECGGKKAEQLYADILAKRDKEQRALFEKNKTRIPSITK
jgi:hypothetical protein